MKEQITDETFNQALAKLAMDKVVTEETRWRRRESCGSAAVIEGDRAGGGAGTFCASSTNPTGGTKARLRLRRRLRRAAAEQAEDFEGV